MQYDPHNDWGLAPSDEILLSFDLTFTGMVEARRLGSERMGYTSSSTDRTV